MVMIPVELNQDLEEAARALGLLTSEKIAQMIEAEVWRKRQAAWRDVRAMTEPIRADFQAVYGHLSDEEAQAMIDQWIAESDEGDNPPPVAPDA